MFSHCPWCPEPKWHGFASSPLAGSDATGKKMRRYQLHETDVENVKRYRIGGFHPTMIDDVLHDRYRIVDKLGYGGFATVWLARDTKQSRYVALKICIAESRSREPDILRTLCNSMSTSLGRRTILWPLDEFTISGPNGTHQCFATDLAAGTLRAASFSRLFPLNVVRALSYRLASAIAFTHSQGFVHGDIRLSNVLYKTHERLDHLSVNDYYRTHGDPEIRMQSTKTTCPLHEPQKLVVPVVLGKRANEFTLQDTEIYLHDFGEAFRPADHVRPAEQCRTPQPGLPPEAVLDPNSPISFPSDIWSLATTIWGIIGMQPIFLYGFATNDELIADQIDMLGPLPPDWWERWAAKSEFFDSSGKPIAGREVFKSLEQWFQTAVQEFRAKLGGHEVFDSAEVTAILHLIRGMLRFRPEDRLTAEEVLKSSWMVDWCLPEVADIMPEDSFMSQ